jgi:hypothetical protein
VRLPGPRLNQLDTDASCIYNFKTQFSSYRALKPVRSDEFHDGNYNNYKNDEARDATQSPPAYGVETAAPMV